MPDEKNKNPRDLCCPKCAQPVNVGRAISSAFVRQSWNCSECGTRLSFCRKRYLFVSVLNWIFCCIILMVSVLAGLMVTLGSFFIFAAFLFIMAMMAFSSRYYKVVVKE